MFMTAKNEQVTMKKEAYTSSVSSVNKLLRSMFVIKLEVFNRVADSWCTKFVKSSLFECLYIECPNNNPQKPH